MTKNTNNVVTLNADTKAADLRHAAERATLLQNLDTAEDMLQGGLVAAIRMTVTLGRTSAEEVGKNYTRCNSPKVYASQFNLGDRAQQAIGQKATLDLIDRVDRDKSAKGAAFPRVVAALRAVCEEAANITGKPGKAVTTKQAQGVVRAAVAKATAPKAAKPAEDSAKRGARGNNSATLAAAASQVQDWSSAAGFALLLSTVLHKLEVAEGRETICHDARKLAEELADTLSPMIRKHVRKAA